MKALLLRLTPLAFVLITALTAHAQDSYGIRIGYAPASDLSNNHVIINGVGTDMTFNTDKANKSFYAGGFYRRALNDGFFLQGEALYAYRSNNYIISYLDNDAPDSKIHEISHRLSLPASVGIDLGAVEVLSGFTPNIRLAQNSDFTNFSGFSDEIPVVTFAWHTGIGVSMQQLKFEVRYQMNFSNYGANMYLYDQHLQLSNAGNGFVFGISYGI